MALGDVTHKLPNVADIAGHGLSAGILMGMLKTSIGTQLLEVSSPTASDWTQRPGNLIIFLRKEY
jgi:hypothetical protein